MKYILPFLLLSLYCTAQNYDNYVKITAVRIVDPDREGHTLITGFIKDDAYLGNRLQALQDDDEQLAFALLNLKKEARQWDKRLLPNNNGRDTPLKVPNMYVVQINRHRDTIFTTHNNASIYFPDEQMEYIDKNNSLNSLLNEKVCSFTERNFKEEFIYHRNDSISASTMLLNGKPVFGHTRKSFNNRIKRFQRVTTDSIFEGGNVITDKQFWINNYKLKFEGKLKSIEAFLVPGAKYVEDVAFSAGGIQLEDSEDKLAETFPCSLEYRNMNATVYDINNNYYYTVHLVNGKGYVLFFIKNKRVDRIEVTFL